MYKRRAYARRDEMEKKNGGTLVNGRLRAVGWVGVVCWLSLQLKTLILNRSRVQSDDGE